MLISPAILEDIRTDSFLKYMYKHVLAFDRYLDSTSNLTINLKGFELDLDDPSDAPDPVEYKIPYKMRWTKVYDNMQLCGFYNLEWFFALHPDQTPNYTMMITLTGTHATPRNPKKGGLGHMAYLAKFHEAHRKAKDLMRKYLETDRYLSMLEGHPKSGYAHAHNLYFLYNEPSQKALDTIQNHWNNTLGMGSAKHGIKIVVNQPRNFNDIKSFIAYSMAYLGKTTIGDLPEWSKYDVIFNTCLWLSPRPKNFGGIGHRVRACQPSRALSRIMHPHPQKGGYMHLETSVSDKKRNDSSVLYQASSYDVNIVAWENFGGDEPDCPIVEVHEF